MYICQKCGKKSGIGNIVYLHPHHIKSFAKYPKLRFIVVNGLTLCKECHKMIHKKIKPYNQTKVKQRLRKEADDLFYLVVLKRWGRVCEICGKPSSKAHHFFAKSHYGHLRYELLNGISLCYHHHQHYHNTGDPLIIEQIIHKRGDKWYNTLSKLAKNNPKSFKTVVWYREQIDQLKERLCSKE